MIVSLELNCLGLSHLLHPLNVYDLGRVVFIFLYHHFFINGNNNRTYILWLLRSLTRLFHGKQQLP